MSGNTPGKSLSAHFRKNFVTGLLVLAPVWITVYLVLIVVRALGGFVSPYLRTLAGSLPAPEQWLGVISWLADVVGFLITIVLIALVGALVRRVVGRRLFHFFERLVTRIPVIRAIYEGVTKFIQTVFADRASFQRVVAIRFPNDYTWSIGFVTSTRSWQLPERNATVLLSVFVPHTPNPTSGFTVIIRPEYAVDLDLTVDEAIKLVMSGGVVMPPVVAQEDTLTS